MKANNDYYVIQGYFNSFPQNQRKTSDGLNLNKLIRTVLKTSCGIPCPNCKDGDCDETLPTLLTSVDIPFTNAAGESMSATVLSAPTYANDAAAAADNFPINGLYYDANGILRKRIA